jgi:hypothetical protein
LRFFHAGYEGFEKIHPVLLDVLPNRLVAFDQLRRGKFDDLFFGTNRKRFEKLMLDSGAFWAWRHNGEINRADYTKYCLDHAKDFDIFVSLDRIPGRFLTKQERQEQPRPPESEYKISAQVSYENYLHLADAMEKKGISRDKIVYVFHQGENPDTLAERVEIDKLPYIGLSPSDPYSFTVPQKRDWLTECMNIIKNTDGSLKNNVKLHSFGLSTLSLIADFPWYSIDNSVWGGRAKLYFIYAPKLREGGPRGPVSFGDNWEEQITAKWDFSTLERVDMGFVRKSSSYFRKKKLPKDYETNPEKRRFRQEQANYIMTIFHYCYDLGLKLGHSELVRRSYDTDISQLQHNESFLSAHLSDKLELREFETISPDKQWSDIKVIKGVMNCQLDRMWLNAITLNSFAKQVSQNWNGQR